jgi:UDP-N-acetylglucosamine 2-epimerase (non-hydrolysing)
MKIAVVCGARPNFIKIAALTRELAKHPEIGMCLVHTGQHYDARMSELFFSQLEIPKPDVNLGVGSGTHAVQTAEVMKRFEEFCGNYRPSHVLVVGDVNSTIACGLVAAKQQVGLIHVEAGLRSFDRSMPEEINRVLTDQISDLLFISEQSGVDNLRREGVAEARLHLVGNVMIDTLLTHRVKAEASPVLGQFNLQPPAGGPVAPYAVATLHRPANVDNQAVFAGILDALDAVGRQLPVIFPVHPRTKSRILASGRPGCFVWNTAMGQTAGPPAGGIILTEPMGYLDFLKLMGHARLVITDSGGIQEETTILRVPCATVRLNTERPVTLTHGTNRLVGVERSSIIDGCLAALGTDYAGLPPPPLWDGHAAERIVRVLRNGPSAAG